MKPINNNEKPKSHKEDVYERIRDILQREQTQVSESKQQQRLDAFEQALKSRGNVSMSTINQYISDARADLNLGDDSHALIKQIQEIASKHFGSRATKDVRMGSHQPIKPSTTQADTASTNVRYFR